jgi:ribosomal protein S18 acetylase RimI-like enzyme
MKLSDIKLIYGVLPNQSTEQMAAFAPAYPAPVGFVWFVQAFGAVNICYIWVHEKHRRRGIASLMLAELKVWYPATVIATELGNEMSTPWLIKHGFVHCTEPRGLHGWFWVPDKNCKRKGRKV